jgi:hypothetical protein
VVPGWLKETQDYMPPGLGAFSRRDFGGFHTLDWWQNHFSWLDPVKIDKCDYLPDGKRIWLDSAHAMYETKQILRSTDGTPIEARQKELDFWQSDINFLEADKDDFVGLIRIIFRLQGVPDESKA